MRFRSVRAGFDFVHIFFFQKVNVHLFSSSLSLLQVACYKIVESLYLIGTDLKLTNSRKFLKTEIATHRASIGTCLAAISSTLPVSLPFSYHIVQTAHLFYPSDLIENQCYE